MDRREERRLQVHRRRTWRVLALVVVGGALLLFGLDAWLRHLAQAGLQDRERVLGQLAVAGTVIHVLIGVVALMLGRVLSDWARQAQEQHQWPPAGLQLLGNRPVRHGEDASRIARRLRILGYSAVVFGALMLAWTTWRLLG